MASGSNWGLPASPAGQAEDGKKGVQALLATEVTDVPMFPLFPNVTAAHDGAADAQAQSPLNQAMRDAEETSDTRSQRVLDIMQAQPLLHDVDTNAAAGLMNAKLHLSVSEKQNSRVR